MLGTAALGLRYGLAGEEGAGPPSPPVAVDVIHAAENVGVYAFDTAPSYGAAEILLGRALGGRGRVWTKVGVAADLDRSLPGALASSVDASLSRLKRSRLQLVQWHNWTAGLADDPHFQCSWRSLRQHPAVEELGATTYGAADARAAVTSGLFGVVQVEWNLLNQATLKALKSVPLGRTRVAVRSVFLQGVLTRRGERLPSHLAGLRGAVDRARRLAERWGIDLQTLALRAALDQAEVAWVVVGAVAVAEIQQMLSVARLPPLGLDQRMQLEALDHSSLAAVDPRTWVVS